MHPIYHPHIDIDTITDRVRLGDIFAFDIDGTLTEPNEYITHDQAHILKEISNRHPIIILTARDHETIYDHILAHMPIDTSWENWYLASANGGQIYRYHTGQEEWKAPQSLYEMSEEDRRVIKKVFREIQDDQIIADLHPTSYIEDRLTNLTIVIYPRKIQNNEGEWVKTPANIRNSIDPERQIRTKVISEMHRRIPYIAQKYEWHIGGATSIDIKDPQAVKGPNLEKLVRENNWQNKHIVFFGDELTAGGDQSLPYIRHTLLTAVEVTKPKETYSILQSFLLSF